MKNKFVIFLLFVLAGVVIFFSIEPVTDKLAGLLRHEPTVVIPSPNAYYRNMSFKFVQESKDFIPYSRQDLKNIFYSILNNGYEIFTFYCPSEYTECVNDVDILTNEPDTLTHINNYVHPFNNFDDLEVTINTSGEITVRVTKLYSHSEINKINREINSIIANNITDDMDLEEKILTIHDHIATIAKYDIKKRDVGSSPFNSSTAYGPLFEGHAICGGFTDALALFLNRFEVPNFKVASDEHVWNAIFIDDRWLHIDLTWNNPMDPSNPNLKQIEHKFFLITTTTLEGYDTNEHVFNKTIYRELLS